jgi:hypothetical protein
MYRHRYSSRRLTGKSEDVVAADDTTDHESCLRECSYDLLAAGDRQSTAALLRRYRNLTNFGLGIGRNGNSVVLPI